MIRQREAVHGQQGVMMDINKPVKVEDVKAGKQHRRYHNYNKHKPANRRGRDHDTKCNRCGRDSHSRQDCPAKDVICHNCKKRGHFSVVCYAKRKAPS